MGKQSRARNERRIERMRSQSFTERYEGRPVAGEPQRILTSFHGAIQNDCGESGRRCWEYMLEILALSSGWNTETNESEKLWPKFANDSRLEEFVHSWYHEVIDAKRNGGPFSEPIGGLLHEVQGTSDHLGQFLTPMPVVRMMNAMSMHDLDAKPLQANGMPTHRGLDPACGTGRFMIDALVHNSNIMMHGVDLDQWMVRAAMLNVRLLAAWTSLRLTDWHDVMSPLRRARNAVNMLRGTLAGDPFEPVDRPTNVPVRTNESTLIIGGRAIFINGNSLIVDLDHAPNWLRAGWSWCPPHWSGTMKISGHDLTYNEWVDAGSPAAGRRGPEFSTDVQFDYSMANKKGQPHANPSPGTS